MSLNIVLKHDDKIYATLRSSKEQIEEGDLVWDFDEEGKDLPRDLIYTLEGTIESDLETKSFKRSVTLWPTVAEVDDTNEVRKVSCALRFPFENKVDVDFYLKSFSEKTTPVFKVKFYGKLSGDSEFLLEEYGVLEGEGAAGIVLNAGDHRVTWTPSEEKIKAEMAKMKVKVVAEEVTESAKYLKVDLGSGKVTAQPNSPSVYASAPCKTTEMWFRRIEPGFFNCGCHISGWYEPSVSPVIITKAYYIGIFEVTQKQFDLINGRQWSYADNGSTNTYAHLNACSPAESVAYQDIRGSKLGVNWWISDACYSNDFRVDKDSWIGKFRAKTGNGLIFDLPTGSQWEYACRAGTYGRWNWGEARWSAKDEIHDDFMWCLDNSNNRTHEVGTKKPNRWGLYDMHGNVGEWGLDYANSSYYNHGGYYSYDPIFSESYNVIMGDDYNYDFLGSYGFKEGSDHFSTSYRTNITRSPLTGFRLVLFR